jgi:RNA polymerase sigma-70 factor (ECF subfamily)
MSHLCLARTANLLYSARRRPDRPDAAAPSVLYSAAVPNRMSSSTEVEAALLARARDLDTRALAQIHDLYFPALYRYALYRTGDADTAADIAGEVFLRLLDALHGRRPPQTTLRGWLFGVAGHLVADHFRRAPVATLPEDLPDGLSVAGAVEDRLRRGAVQAGLRRLTEEQQQVLALRFGDGFSVEETAASLGKSITAVKALQFRAIEALRRLLGGEATA